MQIEVPDSEVVDRITILELKARHLQGEPALRAEARRAHLVNRWEQHHGALSALPHLAVLREVNTALWEVEDALRMHEAQSRFDTAFIELARSVYRLNDQRAAVKAQIDSHTGSGFREEKSYGTRHVSPRD